MGFAVASPPLADRLHEELGPWAVSGPALAVGQKALADEGTVPATLVADALRKYGINPDKPNPALV